MLFGLFQEFIQTEWIFLKLYGAVSALLAVRAREILIWNEPGETGNKGLTAANAPPSRHISSYTPPMAQPAANQGKEDAAKGVREWMGSVGSLMPPPNGGVHPVQPHLLVFIRVSMSVVYISESLFLGR